MFDLRQRYRYASCAPSLSRPLVVGRKRDRRRCYDPEAKRELVEVCLQPRVSVAGMALEHGINANVLRKWIGDYREAVASVTASLSASWQAFAGYKPTTP